MSTALGLIVGATLGVIAGGFGSGTFRRWVDTAIMRMVDIMLSIPSLLLAVSIAAVLGQNTYSVMIAIGAAQVPIFARLLRGSMLGQGKADYVLAAGALGIRKRRIVMGHVLPNSLGPDHRPGDAQPGHRDHRGRGAVLPRARRRPTRPSPNGAGCWSPPRTASTPLPRLALCPGFAIAITALGFTLFGEALREALDPKDRRR